jgi:hypothetical protein
MGNTTKDTLLIHTKTFRAHMWQRFRHNASGRQYVLTQTKRGTTTVWVPMTCKVLGPCAVAEQWRKADASEAAEAINDIAAWHGNLPEFKKFFGVAS